MSVLSLSYWESDVYWRQNNKHFAELAPQNGGKQLIWRNYVTVTLCIALIVVNAKHSPLWSLVGLAQSSCRRYVSSSKSCRRHDLVVPAQVPSDYALRQQSGSSISRPQMPDGRKPWISRMPPADTRLSSMDAADSTRPFASYALSRISNYVRKPFTYKKLSLQ